MAKLTPAQIAEVTALYDAGEEAKADALREQYKSAPAPVAAPVQAPAAVKQTPRPARAAAPRPPTAVVPPSRAPAPESRLWGSISPALKEVPPSPAAGTPAPVPLVVRAQPIPGPVSRMPEVAAASGPATSALTLKYIQTGATKEGAAAAAAAGVRRMETAPTDTEGKQIPSWLTTGARTAVGSVAETGETIKRALVPQRIVTAPNTARSMQPNLTRVNSERAKQSQAFFDSYKDDAVKVLPTGYTSKELYDKMEKNIRGDMAVRADQIAGSQFRDIVGRDYVLTAEEKALEEKGQRVGLSEEQKQLAEQITDTLVGQVLPQRVKLDQSKKTLTTSGALWDWLSTSERATGDVYESVPAAALRDIATAFQWAYKPIQKAVTYDVSASGTAIDENDLAYRIEQKLPASVKNSPVLGKTIIPRPFQGRKSELAPRQGYLDEAAASVAKGEYLGDLFNELPIYKKAYDDAGLGFIPEVAGLGLELANPYLTPIGVGTDLIQGGAGLASKGARVAGLGKTANALEALSDPMKALERSRSAAKATNIARGTDAFKDVTPAYREATEIASARNVIADKVASAVIPVAMLDNEVAKAERIAQRYAERARAPKAFPMKDPERQLRDFWARSVDSGLMDQPAVLALINKATGNQGSAFELTELRKALNEWKAEFDVSASPEAQHLYAIGKAESVAEYGVEGVKFDMNGVLKRGKEYINEETLNSVPVDLVFVAPTVVAKVGAVEKIMEDLGLRMQDITRDVKFKDGKAILPDGRELSATEYTRWFNDEKTKVAKELLGDEATDLKFTGEAERAASVPKEQRTFMRKAIDAMADKKAAADVRKTPLKLANELTALRNELATIPDEVADAIKTNGFDKVVRDMDGPGIYERAIKLHFGGDTLIPDEVLASIIKEKAGDTFSIDGFNAVAAEIVKRRPDLEKKVPRRAATIRTPDTFATLITLATEVAAERKITSSFDRLAASAPEFMVDASGDQDVIKLVKAFIAHKLATGDLAADGIDADKAVGRTMDFSHYDGEDVAKYMFANQRAEQALLQWGAHTGIKVGEGTALGKIPSAEQMGQNTLFFGLDTAAEVERFRTAAETGTLARNLDALRLSNDRASMAYAGELIDTMNRTMMGGLLGGNYLPNFRFHGANFMTAPFIVATTVGLPNALGAGARMFDWQLAKRAASGDTVMFVGKDGRQWTKAALDEAIKKNNIKFSQATFEFGPQIIEDMRTVARVGADGKPISWAKGVIDTLTPNLMKSNMWKKLGEQSDVLWRENVFVTALKEGRTQEDAAKLARESMLDYRAISPEERAIIARWFLFYSFQRQMTKATINAAVTDPRTLQRTIQTQQSMTERAGEDTGVMSDNYLGRLSMYGGKVYDAAKKTMQAGPDVPSIAALQDMFTVAAWAMRAADPTIRDSSLQEAADALVDRGTTPTVGLLLKMGKYQPENKDTGHVEPHLVAALQYSGAWPAAVEYFHIKPVATESRRGGEPTFEGSASSSGKQYRFDDQTGYNRWLVWQWLQTEAGAKRTTDDWTKTLILAGLAPEGAELKRLKDGNWVLYTFGVQTPIALPTKIQAQVDAEERVLRELLEVKKD